jgi:hypothetical protein
VIELGAGLALLALPSTTAVLLLGVPLEVPAGVTVARVAGVALLALSVACWLARGDNQSRSARGLVAGRVLYNVGVAFILVAAGIPFHLVGVALWPAVLLHALLATLLVRAWFSSPRQWRPGSFYSDYSEREGA